MCTEHKIAFNVIKEYLESKKEFSFKELQNEIVKRGGILRVSAGYSIGKYILELEEDGLIEFNSRSKTYQVHENQLLAL